MAIIDEMKRRARRAGFEAERVVRVNRVQSRIATLQGQLSSGITRLGYLTYDLAGRGEIDQPQLQQFCAQLDKIRAQITEAEAEIRAIQTEPFADEPTHVACPSCGTLCPAQARFCQGCGSPLAPAAPPSAPPVFCRGCGTGNSPDMRFCIQCGQPLTRSGGLASQQAPTVRVAPPRDLDAPASVAAVAPMHAAAQTQHLTSSTTTSADVANTGPEAASGSAIAEGAASSLSMHDVPLAPAGDRDSAPSTAEASSAEAHAAPTPAAERHCAACGETVPGAAQFCVGCGQPVAPSR